jgi:methylglutaconyl-CoA hydratase
VSVKAEHRDRVLWLTLDRPAVRNAFDDTVIADLTRAFGDAAKDEAVRIVVLAAEGPVFSAGADLDWMRRMSVATDEESLADARRLAALMRAIDTCPKPTIARVQGSAFAGAVGLIACADIAVTVPEAEFAVTEVRLGLIPATISPYLVRAMGARAARRLFLTGERFPATEALRLGLVHEVVTADRLDAAVDRYVAALLAGAPEALAAAKRLPTDVDVPITDALIEETARRIAERRMSSEAKEGFAAFFEKRKPRWRE